MLVKLNVKFEWEVVKSSSSYGGGFPKGYLGAITYKVSNQFAQGIADGSFNVSSGKTTFKDFPLNKKTRTTSVKMSEKHCKIKHNRRKKRLCTKILDNFRGPIILRPK